MNLTNLSEVRALLDRHGFSFSKALGQNFLVNPSVAPRMAEGSGAEGVGVLEIGPGIGTLTRELCLRAKKVVAIELDKRLPDILAETLAEFDNVKIVPGDAMELDLHALLRDEFGDMPVVVCANLPFYITSPMLMRLLEDHLPVEAITVLVQKEAADRLCSDPGTRVCGAVSVSVAYYADPVSLFSVSRGSFLPAPNVDCRVIRLNVRPSPLNIADEKGFFRMIRAAFGQRRKTLPNALSGGMGLSKEKALLSVTAAGLRPTARAEELTLENWAALWSALSSDEANRA